MCSTSRFGFARVPYALNLELNLLRLFEVALVVASWRVLLHCSRRNALSPLRLACCAHGRAVLFRSRGRPPNPISLSYSVTYQHSAISMRRRIVFSYSKIHRRATLRACSA
jgi:hypothetical protein